jgi:hypothetical protein
MEDCMPLANSLTTWTYFTNSLPGTAIQAAAVNAALSDIGAGNLIAPGQTALGTGQQAIPNAVVGAQGTFNLIPSTIRYDLNVNNFQYTSTLLIDCSVTYVTTTTQEVITTTQTVDMQITLNPAGLNLNVVAFPFFTDPTGTQAFRRIFSVPTIAPANAENLGKPSILSVKMIFEEAKVNADKISPPMVTLIEKLLDKKPETI